MRAAEDVGEAVVAMRAAVIDLCDEVVNTRSTLQELTEAIQKVAGRMEPWRGQLDPDVCCECGHHRRFHRKLDRPDKVSRFKAVVDELEGFRDRDTQCPSDDGTGWIVAQCFQQHPKWKES